MNGSKKDADDIYNLGIARKASPLDRLQSRYNEFQKRMLSGAAIPSTATSLDASSSTSESRPSRSQRPALTTSRSTLTSSGSSRPITTPSGPNSRLQIFVDPSGVEAEAAEAAAWPDLGTRKSRVKENIPEVKKLAGTTIKQSGRSKRVTSGNSGSSTAASSSRLVPYRDPEPVGMPPPPVPVSKKTAPFADCGDAAGAPSPTPATPRFTPFRDDVSFMLRSLPNIVNQSPTRMRRTRPVLGQTGNP